MESIFNGMIEFTNEGELQNFLKNIDKPNAIKMLEMALECGNKSGIYSIVDTHVIYTCLLKLKENETNSVCNNGDSGSSNS